MRITNEKIQMLTISQFWFDLAEYVQYMFLVLRLVRLADSDEPILGKVYDQSKQISKHLEGNQHMRNYFKDIHSLWFTAVVI